MIVCFLVVLLTGATAPPGDAGGKSPTDVTISDLDWLTGYWVSEKSGATSEECWLPPKGGVMLGLHRDVFEESGMFFEYLRIVQTIDGLVYYATPRNHDTTMFALTALENDGNTKQAVFENPEHDFPNLIRYTLSEDGLKAEVEGIEDDQRVVNVWVWHRAEFFRNPTR
jgi:hypothetical protein